MKTVKLFPLALACVLIAAAFAGCSGSSGGTSTSGAPAAPASSAAPADSAAPTQGEFIIKFGHHHNVGSTTDKMCNKFKELIEERTQGRVKVDIYPGAQLGQEYEASEGVMIGVQQMTAVSPMTYLNVVDGFGVDSLPFLFNDWEQLWHVFNDTEVGKILDQSLLDKGARILGWTPLGGRHMIFVEKNITSIDQMKGLKMRSPESETYMDMFNALGASPTPITWGEAYSALQMNVVDGMETPLSGLTDMNFGEVTKYVLKTNHIWGAFTIIINEQFYQTFPADLQEQIATCGKEAVRYCYEIAKEADEGYQKFWEEKGIVFNELSDDDKTKLAELMGPVRDKWAEGGPGRRELLDLLATVSA